MPIAEHFSAQTNEICEVLLVRALTLLGEQMPTLRTVLFGDCELDSCSANTEFDFADGVRSPWLYLAVSPLSVGEPAINLYTAGGRFGWPSRIHICYVYIGNV